MDWPLFILLMLAPGFVGLVIGMILIIIQPPKDEPIHPRHKFKAGDIVELKTGKIAIVIKVDSFLNDVEIRIQATENIPFRLNLDGTDPCPHICADYSIVRVIGHADYVV